MAFQPVPNVAQIVLEGRVDSQQTINDLYFGISGGGITVVNLQTLVDAMTTWFGINLAQLLSDDWACVRVIGIDLTSQSGPRVENAVGNTGAISGEANPNNVAATVSLRTGLRGRSFRGRNFVPAIPGSVVTLNTLDPTFISDLLNEYNILVGPGTFLAGWELVVVSRIQGGVVLSNGVATPVTSVTMVGNSVRSMRSREVGHGA